MRSEELKAEISAYHAAAIEEATKAKDMVIVQRRLKELYGSLSQSERDAANELLNEWLVSSDSGFRFDARVLIDQFKIATAIPALRALSQRLKWSLDPPAQFELEAVQELIRKLEVVANHDAGG